MDLDETRRFVQFDGAVVPLLINEYDKNGRSAVSSSENSRSSRVRAALKPIDTAAEPVIRRSSNSVCFTLIYIISISNYHAGLLKPRGNYDNKSAAATSRARLPRARRELFIVCANVKRIRCARAGTVLLLMEQLASRVLRCYRCLFDSLISGSRRATIAGMHDVRCNR